MLFKKRMYTGRSDRRCCLWPAIWVV